MYLIIANSFSDRVNVLVIRLIYRTHCLITNSKKTKILLPPILSGFNSTHWCHHLTILTSWWYHWAHQFPPMNCPTIGTFTLFN